MRLATLLAALSVATPTMAAPLAEAEIRSELVGQTLLWWDDGGWFAGALTLLPDGRAEITVDTPKPSSDVGRWTLEGDALCTTWASVRSGAAKCYTLERTASGRFVTSGGNVFEIRAAGV